MTTQFITNDGSQVISANVNTDITVVNASNIGYSGNHFSGGPYDGDVQLNLPAASDGAVECLLHVKSHSSAWTSGNRPAMAINNVCILPNGSDTITYVGGLNSTLLNSGTSPIATATLVSDGVSNWIRKS